MTKNGLLLRQKDFLLDFCLSLKKNSVFTTFLEEQRPKKGDRFFLDYCLEYIWYALTGFLVSMSYIFFTKVSWIS